MKSTKRCWRGNIAPPTLVALINPHKGKFNVTAKGGLVEEEYVD
ncbi:cellulose synthase catalytic subunit [Escherichia coli]|uniref:Cellulose synthase catalytic subunit n=1 Tax=Escherichia coli TaxID=562 RepID=A0A376TYU6_ECOLX|nr:cellulose synthase catalytic subunit [Escherichia coli]